METFVLKSLLEILRSLILVTCDARQLPRVLHSLAFRINKDSASCRSALERSLDRSDLAVNLLLLTTDMASTARSLDASDRDIGMMLNPTRCGETLFADGDDATGDEPQLNRSNGGVSIASGGQLEENDWDDDWDDHTEVGKRYSSYFSDSPKG